MSTQKDNIPRGVALLHDPLRNKGTAFTEVERDALGLRGLLPPHIHTQDEQMARFLAHLRGLPDALEQFVALSALHDRNEALFFRVVCDNVDEIMPLIYTPTVGLACQRFGHIFQRPRGMFISINDRGRIAEILRNWPLKAGIIVVTDGERILGLGDLGANGMGIPIGKLTLYTACAGMPPNQCLPITIDVGTDNATLRESHSYVGLRQPRLRGAAYDELMDEFVEAVEARFPRVCLQFEDFGNHNAFSLLARWRDRICTFNDDIQGTASVALAGLYSSTRLTNVPLKDMRILFFGAGEAGIGIGDLVVEALIDEGMPEAEARKHCWFVDSKGLIVHSRTDLAAHKQRYAHEHEPVRDLLAAVESIKPHAIIGVSGMPGMFTKDVLHAMARHNEHPVILALSNPTSKAECTAHQAYAATEGRAIFASGSPFAPVTYHGKTHVPGQGNNSYIFPGVGLGVLVSESSRVTDEMFAVAARTLAGMVTSNDLDMGRLYPSLSRIREVSREIAIAVAEIAFKRGLARVERPADLADAVSDAMYQPYYTSMV